MLPTIRFLSFINQQKLFAPSDKILLAVSGGRDSVLLAHLFNATEFNFGIAHCNFGLRDEESDADEVFAAELAQSFNAPFHRIRFNTLDFAIENKVSIQMAARELRYKWFEETRKKSGYQFIALAHHLSDTTETVLLNLIRGTGISGLHGILPKRGNLIRPLLFLTRDEIAEIIKKENIPFREDSSNLSSKYARNKIRLEVIPKMKEFNTKLDETFEENCRRFSQVEDFLNIQVDLIRNKIFKKSAHKSFEIELEDLRDLNPLPLLLYELFKPYNFSEAVLEDLSKSWNGQAGKTFASSTHVIILDRNKVILKENIIQETEEAFLDEANPTITFNNIHIRCTTRDKENVQITNNKNQAYFDASLLQFPLRLRQWNEGDYFYPFGMKGKKKLSDFFTGLKIPLSEKKNIPLLVNANGDILWVVGYRTDNRYKVKPETKKVITFEKA